MSRTRSANHTNINIFVALRQKDVQILTLQALRLGGA
jgi:hypothetical protein